MPEVRSVSIFRSVRSDQYPIDTNLTESYFLLSHKRIIILRTMEITHINLCSHINLFMLFMHSYFQVIGNCKYMFCKNFSRPFLT